MVVYDWSEAALAAAIVALALVLVMELRSTRRLHRLVGQELPRIFEQLDLVRFENQQLLEQHALATASTGAVVPSAVPAAAIAAVPMAPVLRVPPAERATADYGSAAQLAAAGADAAEIAARTGLGGGEARMLAALQSARNRRGPRE